MNMYLVQTVSSRPRPWSSYTNINSKEVPTPVRMNSAEEISKYHDHNSHYCSPVLARRTAGTSYDFPEKSPKKDKKWSLGSLFRRKKKAGSESSSEEENEGKNFLQKKKKKSEKRKRTNKTIGFDHVVVPPSSRRTTLTNGYKSHEDSLGILSEPSFTGRTVSKNFIPASDFTSRLVPLKDSQDSFDRNGLNRSNNSLGSPSVSSLGRKKEKVKARAEARRDTSKGEESSEDDSQKSAFKSDESLTKQRDAALSKKSRAARTQRYLRRRSKDDDCREPLRTCKSDVEHDHSRNVQHLRLPDERMQNMKSASKSPILSTTPKSKLCYTNSAPPSRPNFSGLSTIPPSHSSHSKYRTINSTNGPSHKQFSSFHDYNDTKNKYVSADLNNQRSISCDANIHNAAPSSENEPEVVHVQFPLGKPFIKRPTMIINQQVNPTKKQPPPPPPRDPRRILTVQNSDGRPISYSFENGYQSKNGSDQQLNKPQQLPETNRNSNLNPNCRSTSEDHISLQPSQRMPIIPRPSSATPEANRLQKLAKSYTEHEEPPNGYRYLTDKNPRSRKPICIQSCNQTDKADQQNKKPFDFWRQKDEEVSRRNTRKSAPGSPLMFTAQTHVRTNIFLPNGVTVETEPPHIYSSESIQREASPFRPVTPPKLPLANADQPEKITNGSIDEDVIVRKSSNLEDALDELEAIYNSLHLGDEDLLERAEQREAEAAQKRRDAAFESFPNSVPRGALSDSSFGYEANFDSTRRKKYTKRAEPDRKADDMAFRKLNKERFNTISDPQSAVSKVSYLLTSPVFSAPVDDSTATKSNNNEPDVTYDDVVYRNVKHTNNCLKVADPQLPFGIPIGPILPASNSDYLHATPEATQRFSFKPRKIPDVVKDDLAYRNLRKDPNKEPALPQSNFSPEDYINNNGKTGEAIKKKRAVRSLSANIFNLMQKEWKSNAAPVSTDDSKQQKIGDVADALEIARKILKEKENKISATRKAFMSDGELKYRKYGCSSPTEQRVNFLNEMKSSTLNNENVYHHKLQVNIPAMDYDRLEAKPPTPDRSRRGSRPSKESTPIPTSPCEDAQIKKLQQSTLDDLLTSLAVEARETSERITNELKMYGEEKEKLRNDQEKLSLSNEKLKELEKDAISASLNLQISDVDSTSEHAKLCEKLMECVVDGTELLATTKIESEPSEEVAGITIEPLLPETVANVVLTPSDKSKLDVPVSTEVFSESDHDYVNIQSPDEAEKELTESKDTTNIEKAVIGAEMESSTELDEEEKELLLLDDDSVSLDICLSPLERHKAELVAAFQELRDGTLKKKKREGVESIEQTDKGGGEECVSVEYIALPTQGCAFTKEARFDFGLNQDETERHLNVHNFDFDMGAEDSNPNEEIWMNDDSLESLKSPKLVRNLNTIVSECQSVFDDFELNLGEALGNNSGLVDANDKSTEILTGSVKCFGNFNGCATELNSVRSVDGGADEELNFIRSRTEQLNDDLERNCDSVDDSYGGDLRNSFHDLERKSLNYYFGPDESGLTYTSNDWGSNFGRDLEKQQEFTKGNHYNSDVVFPSSSGVLHCDFAAAKDLIDSDTHSKFGLEERLGQNLEKRSDSSEVFAGSSKTLSDSEKNGENFVTPALLLGTKSDKKSANEHSSLISRDSRHTLDEMPPTRSWYEDPAVIALACSCGIACTSQLPSFDSIAVLGLLFAIISLFIAFITRT